MKSAIEVSSRNEASAIQAALGDPSIKAFVTMIGALQPLTDVEKLRALSYFHDWAKAQADAFEKSS